MTTYEKFRLPSGGRINRSRPVSFTFDGRRYEGYEGDTVASALLADGQRLFGRSFKYHRPRGIFGSGVDEPNALVTVGVAGRREPNLRATQVEIYEGLTTRSQNRWPSLSFDLGAAAGRFSGVMPAGFYYKTFMWPPGGWRFYEWFIRRAAGLGKGSRQRDPDCYAHKYAHYDVVVVGAGPSGLAAALVSGRAGARVLLVEDAAELGGSVLTMGPASSAREPAEQWYGAAIAELDGLTNVTVLTRTTAFGYYDHNSLTLAERVTDHVAEPEPHRPRHRLWYVRAKAVVLATGSLERPLVFGGNDRPGVMLASAARRFLNQYAVRVGERAICFTNNDTVYPLVLELVSAGTKVAAVVDGRPEGPAAHWAHALREARVEILAGYAVVNTRGNRALRSVDIRRLDTERGRVYGEPRWEQCDSLLISGGWTPTVHLFAQAQGKLDWSEQVQGFVPSQGPAQSTQKVWCVGAMNGTDGLAGQIEEGFVGGAEAAERAGYLATTSAGSQFPAGFPSAVPPAVPTAHPAHPLWLVPNPGLAHRKRFIDFQNDVTVDDVGVAVREGYRSVEHLKRYTTLGMGTDQGRLSNLNGLANLAHARGETIQTVGFTTFRPPYSPVSMGALAGAERGAHLSPYRLTPMHDWHLGRGAKMITVGRWMRPECYPAPGETDAQAAYREARMVRQRVGIVDVSTLGKIELQGPDSAEFLERVYLNRWENLRVGRARYGLMLRDDGMVLDDGTTTRISEQHYYMTTTTGEAEEVMQHLEYHASVSWPELDVSLISVTDQWGALAVAGPYSRAVLANLVDEDVTDRGLPFMAYLEARIAGARCRIFRITFSGELAYEVHMPAGHGEAVWQAFLRAGEAYGVIPYGTEAMAVLRIEKGHVVANELDGRTTPGDVGFSRLMRADGKFIGRRAHERPGLSADRRLELVGVRSLSATVRIPKGGHLIKERHIAAAMSRSERHHVPTEGHITSITYSPYLDAHIALCLLRDGRGRLGERFHVASPLAGVCVPVEVVDPVFVDSEGGRARG